MLAFDNVAHRAELLDKVISHEEPQTMVDEIRQILLVNIEENER